MQAFWGILDAVVSVQNESMSQETMPCIWATCAHFIVHVGVEEQDVEVAKGVLDAIMSGHVEGMPGEDAEMAEDAAQEEAPRGARRCSAHAFQLCTRLFCKARQPEVLQSACNRCEAQPGSRMSLE